MFRCHDYVVYPGHGVARINRIIEKRVGGISTTFYELAFLNKDVMVLVPTENAITVGLRPLSSAENIDKIFEALAEPGSKHLFGDVAAVSWNRRNKGYQLKLRTGSIQELSEIYRDLRLIEEEKPLSFGEKNLLTRTEALLVEEIALVKNIDHDTTVEKLRTSYLSGRKLGPAAF